MIKLIGNEEKIKEYNEQLKKLSAEISDIYDFYQPVNTLDDVFEPYDKWIKNTTPEEFEKYKMIPDTLNDFTGIYIADCNDHYKIEELTDYEEIRTYHGHYGVVDNASQIFENEEIPEDCIVIMMPILKDPDEKGGWRWHKWGRYYGVKEPKCEYLNDEDDDIWLVYCYEIHKLKKID